MVSFAWVAWPLGAPKSPKLLQCQAKIGKMGDLQPRFSPNLSTTKFGKKTKVSFFPQGLWGEFWGKILVETPIFPMVSFRGDQVPKFYLDAPPPGHQKFGDLVRVTLGPKFPKSIGRRRPPKPQGNWRVFRPDFPQSSPKNFGKNESAGLKTLNLPCGGGALGKIWAEPPPFSLCFLSPGWSGAQIPKFPPRATKNLVICPGSL